MHTAQTESCCCLLLLCCSGCSTIRVREWAALRYSLRDGVSLTSSPLINLEAHRLSAFSHTFRHEARVRVN